jgi:peptidyl-prolyl cis-trans isomerase SurA
LAKAAEPLKAGELSPPIRTSGGYYLLLVLDRRNGPNGASTQSETVYDVVQVVFPLPPNANDMIKRQAAEQAVGVKTAAKNCADFLRIGKEKAPQFSSEGEVTDSNITPQMRQLLSKMSPNEATQPILQRNGIGVVMLCSKKTQAPQKPGDPTREEVFDSLLRQKLDTVSRQYMRDLRRAAYVDVRV